MFYKNGFVTSIIPLFFKKEKNFNHFTILNNKNVEPKNNNKIEIFKYKKNGYFLFSLQCEQHQLYNSWD